VVFCSRLKLKPVMFNETNCQVNTLLILLDGSLLFSNNTTVEGLPDGAVERIFLYCLAWSIGGLLELRDRSLFDSQMRTLSGCMPAKVCKLNSMFSSLKLNMFALVSLMRPLH
jgi:dynein heavy chain, axonemal